MISRIGLVFLISVFISCKKSSKTQETYIDSYNYIKDFTLYTSDSLINIVVEIPAGTNQKWEVNKKTGVIEWERINEDSLRVVKYLPYPANYGFIPQTLLPKDQGGDGDPLDVFLLGPSLERGKVVSGRIIGVIKIIDKGEQDDKLLAVSENSHFGTIRSLNELKTNYPGILEILSTWLIHYKGNNLIEIQSIEDENSAKELLNLSVEYFNKN